MNDINNLQNQVIDKKALGKMLDTYQRSELQSLLGVGSSQVGNLVNGIRKPSADGLLRLMRFYKIAAKDIPTVNVETT